MVLATAEIKLENNYKNQKQKNNGGTDERKKIEQILYVISDKNLENE